MDKKLMEELKEKLEEQKKSIQKELESFASENPNSKDDWAAKYPNREDGDRDEDADEVQEYENMLSLEHSLESRLKDISAALEKISSEGYGVCENCKKEIEKERLKAVPEAKLCMQCNNHK